MYLKLLSTDSHSYQLGGCGVLGRIGDMVPNYVKKAKQDTENGNSETVCFFMLWQYNKRFCASTGKGMSRAMSSYKVLSMGCRESGGNK